MPSLGQIYDRFAAQIGNLQEQAANTSDATIGEGQRKWRQPDAWEGDSFDIEGMAAPFSRDDINNAYPDFYVSGGTADDCKAAKWQAVHLGGQERAFRLQSQTGIRCAIHAAARRAGQGNEQSGSFARIVNHIIDMIIAGGS